MMRLKKLNDESGLIAIPVTVIVIALLTLIAIGFANLAGREQRQALDQQLNTQAFYAAESGVNEAIHSGSSTNCSGAPPAVAGDASVTIPCVVVNDKPTSLVYDDVSTDGSLIVPIQPDGVMRSITVHWEDAGGSNRFLMNCDHRLLTNADWIAPAAAPYDKPRTGLLTAMLIPATGFVNRDQLIDRTHNFILYPMDKTFLDSTCNNPNEGNYGIDVDGSSSDFTTRGPFVDGSCEDNAAWLRKCSATLTFDTDVSTTYLLRLRAIYRPAKVTITVSHPSTVGNIALLNAQTEIDSTGRTTDILRRIRVRVPHDNNLYANRLYPEFAVETTNSLCKRLFSIPGGAGEAKLTSGDITALTALGGSELATCQPTP